MNWVDEIRKIPEFQGDLLFDEPLSKHTYFKIGGPAAVISIPKTNDDLSALARFLRSQVPILVLGLGSNLLVKDSGFRGLVIKTTKLPQTMLAAGDSVRVSGGVPVASLLRRAAAEGWDGLEVISGIPGTIGGVVAMNGGTHLGEAADRLIEVRSIDLADGSGVVSTRTRDQLKFSYRKNHFLSPSEIVIDSVWKITHGEPKAIREKLDGLFRRRKETQPLEFPSCGSVFKNPINTNLRAWQVVDRLGLRGHRVGNAQISEKHPNWILNLGAARSVDVITLIDLVKARAKKELGIEMVEEVRIFPED
jgi:UDP-N-acetylmuramate dehydrogenase